MSYIAPMVLHLFLGTIVKLYDLLVNDVRQIDSGDAAAVDRNAGIRDATDFLAGLKLDLENASAVFEDETQARANFYATAKSLLNGNRIDITETKARQQGISEAAFKDAQVAKRLEKEAGEVVAEAKAEVKALQEEIKYYEDKIKELQALANEPGDLEQALEKFLQEIQVRTRFLQNFTLASYAGTAASLLQRRVRREPRPKAAG